MNWVLVEMLAYLTRHWALLAFVAIINYHWGFRRGLVANVQAALQNQLDQLTGILDELQSRMDALDELYDDDEDDDDEGEAWKYSTQG